jgi:hypothetical protein
VHVLLGKVQVLLLVKVPPAIAANDSTALRKAEMTFGSAGLTARATA